MIGIGIVGTGAMAGHHAKRFSEIEGVEVAACVDRDPDRRALFAKKYGLKRAYASVEEMREAHPVEAITCCLVDSLHFETCETALDLGLSVFCEKPLAQTLDSVRRLAFRAAETSDSATGSEPVCMVNFSKRNFPALHALRDLVGNGQLGTLNSVEASYGQSWVATKNWGDWETDPRWKWRLQAAYSSAGVLGDLGVHVLDALLFVFGDLEIVRSRLMDLPEALAGGMVPFAIPDGFSEKTAPGLLPAFVHAEADARINGRVPCSIRVSWIDPLAVDSFVISVSGSRGSAVLDFEKSRTHVWLTRSGSSPEPLELVSGPDPVSTYRTFADALSARKSGRRGREARPDFSDALSSQILIDAMAHLGERVR